MTRRVSDRLDGVGSCGVSYPRARPDIAVSVLRDGISTIDGVAGVHDYSSPSYLAPLNDHGRTKKAACPQLSLLWSSLMRLPLEGGLLRKAEFLFFAWSNAQRCANRYGCEGGGANWGLRGGLSQKACGLVQGDSVCEAEGGRGRLRRAGNTSSDVVASRKGSALHMPEQPDSLSCGLRDDDREIERGGVGMNG